jgi:hypothetical protein
VGNTGCTQGLPLRRNCIVNDVAREFPLVSFPVPIKYRDQSADKMLSIATQLPLFAVSSHGQGKILTWAAMGACVGIYLFFRGFKILQFKRLILNTPASKVRSASMGLVELSGLPEGPNAIPAGITGEPCYYYRATAWEYQRSGNNSEWKRVADESLFVPFFLRDDTGRVLVNAQGADMDVHRNFKDEFGSSFFSSDDMPMGTVQDFLRRNRVSGKHIRLEERCIKPDYPLFVLGTLGENTARFGSTPERHLSAASSSINLRMNPDAAGSSLLQMLGGRPGLQMETNNAPVSSTRAVNTAPQALRRPAVPTTSSWSSVSLDEATKPVAGLKAPAAASGAEIVPAPHVPQSAALQPIRHSGAFPTSAMPPPDLSSNSEFDRNAPAAIGKGDAGAPFTISSESQRELVGALRWKSAACIWGGPALTLACVYILFLTLDWL